jgi:hypothetical protein
MWINYQPLPPTPSLFYQLVGVGEQCRGALVVRLPCFNEISGPSQRKGQIVFKIATDQAVIFGEPNVE